MAVTNSTVQIEAAIHAAIGDLLDTREADMVEAWARAYDTVGQELEDALAEVADGADGTISRTALNRSTRLQAAIDALEESLFDLVDQVQPGMVDDIRAAVRTGEVGQVAMITDQLPEAATLATAGVTVNRADPEQISAMLARSVENMTRDMAAMPVEQAAIIRAELNRGIAVGTSPRETARRIARQMEGRFNYGLNRAMVVSRTETLTAHRNAAQQTEQANADVLAEWEWTAHIGPRTCASCISMHGRRFPLDEPGPLDHQQGRCARTPVAKTWRELGFDIDEPPSLTRSGEDEFNALPENVQRQILGKRGFEQWGAGNFPIEDWSARRENPGWRPSFVPAKAPISA